MSVLAVSAPPPNPSKRRPALQLIIAALVLSLTGCTHYFAPHGTLASEGGSLETWHSTPQGCTRDPFDGLPVPATSSVLTFLWQDPAARNPKLCCNNRFAAPNAPLRLELRHDGPSYSLKLNTVKAPTATLDATVCSTLAVDTRETPRTLPEGRPTLSGTLRLDCRIPSPASTETSHVTANIRFDRCEY